MRCTLAHLAVTLGAVLPLALAPFAAFAGDGTALYEANCSQCHGADGRAQTPVGKAMKVASLAEPKWAEADTADALVAAFRANPKHKAVASKVSDEDLRAISVHVRGLASSK
jgi:cytochrome c6